jgi:hypothetical protein
MALQVINVGTAPNDGTGDAIRTAYIKCNDNFSELYSRAQTTPPTTLVGTVGDQAGMYAYDENFWYYCFADYDSSSIIWSQIAQIGNINVSGIQSGNSDAEFDNINGNLVIAIGSTSNVAVFRSTGLFVNANINAANINATNFYGAVSTASQPNITSVGTLSGLSLTGLLTSSANITTTANVVSATVSSTGNVVATGNVISGNVVATTSIRTPGTVSATGNIVTDGYFVGTFFGNITGNFTIPGGNTQVIYNTAGNADASANFTFNDATNVLQVTGNVSTGNVIATTVSVAGNVTGGNVVSVAAVSAGGNVTGGNLVTSGIVTATSNIASSANVNGANINATSGISASGNVTGGNVNGGTVNAVSNITGSNITVVTATVSGNAAIGNISSAGLISITGNISAGNLNITGNIVDTSALRIVTGSSGNITLSPDGSNTVVITTTGANITGTVSASGNVTGANLITGGLITATGNITSSANVAGDNVIAVSAVSASSVSASGNVTGGNVIAVSAVNASSVSASGNVNGGNIIAASAVNASSVSASGNITGGNLSVGTGSVTAGSIVNANANGVGNIGSATGYFNTVFAQATSAQYADLAEKYIADQNYIPGTVIVIGGSQEVTAANQDHDSAVVGVVSTNPAYTMNSGLEHENVVTVALIGRVPCLVQGPVRRGDLLVTATQGRARSEPNPRVGCVVGKALEDFEGAQGTIEVIVGKL